MMWGQVNFNSTVPRHWAVEQLRPLHPEVSDDQAVTLRKLPVVGEDDQDAVDAGESYQRAEQKSFDNVVRVCKVVAEQNDVRKEVCQDIEVEPKEKRFGKSQENRHLRIFVVWEKCLTIWKWTINNLRESKMIISKPTLN